MYRYVQEHVEYPLMCHVTCLLTQHAMCTIYSVLAYTQLHRKVLTIICMMTSSLWLFGEHVYLAVPIVLIDCRSLHEHDIFPLSPHIMLCRVCMVMWQYCSCIYIQNVCACVHTCVCVCLCVCVCVVSMHI